VLISVNERAKHFGGERERERVKKRGEEESAHTLGQGCVCVCGGGHTHAEGKTKKKRKHYAAALPANSLPPSTSLPASQLAAFSCLARNFGPQNNFKIFSYFFLIASASKYIFSPCRQEKQQNSRKQNHSIFYCFAGNI